MKKFLIFFLFSTGLYAQFSRTASYIINSPSLPATCDPINGAIYFVDSGGGLGPYYCSAVNTWSPMFASSGAGVTTGVTLTADLPVIGAGGSAVAIGTKTGTGTTFVTNTSPTLVTPTLGAALATSINGLIITSTTGTLTITAAKTLSVSNTLTFTGTDASSVAFGTGGTVAYVGVANSWADGVKQTFNPDATNAGLNVGSHTADPSTPANGDIWYNSTGNALKARINGGTVDLGAGGGGGANTALSNLASVSINTALIPQTGVDLGAAATAFRHLYLYGAGTFATTSLQLTGTPTGNRVITFPDATITVADAAPSYIVLGTTANLPNERVLTAGSGITLTDAGAGSTLTVAFDSAVLSGVYFALGSTNAVTGVGNTFTPSATEASIELVGTAVPSSIDAGGLNVGTTGRFGWMDGTNFQLAVSVAGSGAAEPSAPSAGLAKFAGSTFAVTSIPLGTGVETWLGTPSSANLASAVTGETGSGALVFGTAPTINGLTFPTAAGGAVVRQTIASGAKALATSAIASAACSAAQTDTATGTATTDVIIATFNGDPTAVTGYVPLTTGMLTIIAYPTTNTVNFKVCNNTSSSITPGAITLNWSVTR